MARGAKTTTKRKGLSYTRFGYIFIAPFVIVYILFSLYPLLTTFWYSGTNMQSTTADFWGFGDKVVYYDQYLDLTEYFSDNFETEVGISQIEYMKIKNFFATQDAANLYNPLNEEGIQAIIDMGANEFISQATIDKLQTALNDGNLSALDQAAITELNNWKKQFVDLEFSLQSQIGSINSTLDSIVNSASSEEGADALTSEDIVSADNFAEFIDTLSNTEFTEGQQALIAYLEGFAGQPLVDYFTAAQSGEVSIDDPTFYYICNRLSSPKATFGEESISSITVPFLNDLKSYLTTSSWISTITALNSYSNLPLYASGEMDMHDNEEQLYSDIETLESAGILSLVPLEYNGTELVPAESETDNFLFGYRTFIDADGARDSNETEVAAAMQISKIQSYVGVQGRALLIGMGVNVDQYISFNGELDIEKYYEFKAMIGLTDSLSIDVYERLNESYINRQVTKAEEALAEAQANLPAAEAALAALSADDEGYQAALEEVASLKNKIEKNEATIKNPDSLYSKANAKYSYLFVGMDNFAEIFSNKTRFNNVAGAFTATAIVWIIGFVPQILLALLLSAWFTDTKIKLRGLNLMKALMYLPNVITASTVAIFFRRIFSYSNGGAKSASQMILNAFGDADGYNFFESPWATRIIVAFINFWMWYGNTMIVLIAGISSISESLYESAQIDGANTFQTYIKITMPLLRPILLYTLVSSLIGGLQMFDIPQNLNASPALINFNGTMVRSTRTILMYVNDQAFGKQDIKQVGNASAVSILLFIVTTILSILIFYLMRDKDASKAKKLVKKGGTK